jgi:hypothetical protein
MPEESNSKAEIHIERNLERLNTNSEHDLNIWRRITETATDFDRPIHDVLESFPVYIRRINLARFLAHYELYRMVQDLPGYFIECGVFRGDGLFTWAKILETMHPGDRARRVVGFDNMRGFAKFDPEDGVVAHSKQLGGWNGGDFYEELKRHVDIFHDDSYVPRSKRIHSIVEGDLAVTAQQFVENNPGMRIALLHLDVDLYEPTLAALKAFYPLVVKGGVVVLDEYALPPWEGETRAVEEYFGDDRPTIRTFSFTSTPSGYFIKE